jgi:hypothetical protein
VEAATVPPEVLRALPKVRQYHGWRPWGLGVMWLACVSVLLGHGEKVHGDGMAYYTFVRAFVVHGDFRLHDSDLVPTETRSTYLQNWYVAHAIGNRGQVGVGYGVGCSLLWLPGVAVVHAGLLALHGLGVKGLPPADGFSKPYRLATGVTTVLLGLAGLLLAYRLAAELTAPDPAFLAVAGGLFATSLFNYLSYETSMNEGPSFFLVTLIFYLWWRIRESGDGRLWGWWGLAIGLAVIVRNQQLVLALLPAWGRGRARPGAALLGAAAPLLIQLLVWRASMGQWTPPQYATGIESWTKFNPVMLLWSARHGLLASHPLWYVGALGFLPLLRRTGAWGWGLILYFVFLVWLNQLPFDYWAGHSFGARRFVPATLLCILGTAAAIRWAALWWDRAGLAWSAVVVAILIGLSTEALSDYRGLGDARGIASPQGARVMPAALYRAVGWPFSWPANLAWAVRHRVTPDRFDLGSSLCADSPPDFGMPPEDLRDLQVDFAHPNAIHLVAAGTAIQEEDGLLFPDGVARIWINLCRPETIKEVVLATSGEGGFQPVEWCLVSPWRSPGTNVIEISRPGRPLKLIRITLRTTRD